MPETVERVERIGAALARYERPLIRYARRFTGDVERARDIVQDTYLKLCQAGPEVLDGAVGAWLYRVCRNRALDVMAKEQRMQPVTDAQAEALESASPTPGAAAALSETGAAVKAAFDTLPADHHEIIRLKFIDQMSYKEISAITGDPVNHVRYVIHTALKSVRASLRDHLGPALEA